MRNMSLIKYLKDISVGFATHQKRCAHGYEPSTCANYALVLINSSPLIADKLTLLTTTTLMTTSGTK